MRLRSKILSGFVTLAIMLFIAAGWSIMELTSMGDIAENILEKKYRTISSAEIMRDALIKTDKAMLLMILRGEENFSQAMQSAEQTFKIEINNIRKNSVTDEEKNMISGIETNFEKFKEAYYLIDQSSFNKNTGTDWQKTQEFYIETVAMIDKTIRHHDQLLYETASEIKARSTRAIMPGIVAIAAAIIFTILFNYFIDYYMIKPIIGITNKIGETIRGRKQFDFPVETDDEIARLAEEVSLLASYVDYKE